MSRAQSVDVLWSGIRDTSGLALSGGKVYTYLAGTTTPTSLYTSYDKSTQTTNPIVLDANGRATVWADGSYKFIITDSDDVTIETIDPVIYGLSEDESVWAGQSTGSAGAYVLTPSPLS